jgi:UDP-N-acetylmuramoyl-L-alanyl-D-glutamate--2,6-diaminopimelate ligase
MKLRALLDGLAIPSNLDADTEIHGLSLSCDNVQPGFIFFALAGQKTHGLHYAHRALANGAVLILYETKQAPLEVLDDLPAAFCLEFPGLNHCVGAIAERFYGFPAQDLSVIGITGTNGKTSCSQFLGQILPACGVIGTLGWGANGRFLDSQNTTPDALSLQQMFADLKAKGCQQVAMEVSSHGLEQGRVNQINFTGAVLTNISRDHLDYHGSMEAYVRAKQILFAWPNLRFAVINADDPYCADFYAVLSNTVECWVYGIKKHNSLSGVRQVYAEQVMFLAEGIAFDLVLDTERYPVHIGLLGEFNLANCLAVVCVLLAMGYGLKWVADQLSHLNPVWGRMEKWVKPENPTVFIDYAHTPDALNQLLVSLKRHCKGRLVLVFGCGGDRDRGKRPQMGEIACRLADRVFVTTDNPRYEDDMAIIEDILVGCQGEHVWVESDREQAITRAICTAQHDDFVVVAGKGHEQYQEKQGVKLPFSDRDVIRDVLEI